MNSFYINGMEQDGGKDYGDDSPSMNTPQICCQEITLSGWYKCHPPAPPPPPPKPGSNEAAPRVDAAGGEPDPDFGILELCFKNHINCKCIDGPASTGEPQGPTSDLDFETLRISRCKRNGGRGFYFHTKKHTACDPDEQITETETDRQRRRGRGTCDGDKRVVHHFEIPLFDLVKYLNPNDEADEEAGWDADPNIHTNDICKLFLACGAKTENIDGVEQIAWESIMDPEIRECVAKSVCPTCPPKKPTPTGPYGGQLPGDSTNNAPMLMKVLNKDVELRWAPPCKYLHRLEDSEGGEECNPDRY